MKVTASNADSDLYFTPPELLIDVPLDMGCYELSNDNSFDTETKMPDPSPASCILSCAAKGPAYRYAGKIL